MKHTIDNILVFGHFNPDTDASASAASYAEFLNRIGRYDQTAVGAVPGPLTPQAKHVFSKAGVPEPLIIDNVSPLVGHVFTRESHTLSVSDRVGNAVETLVRSDVSMLPVLDDAGNLQGVFSNRSDTARFLLGFDPTPLWGSLLQVQDLVTMPGMNQVGQNTPQYSAGGELRIALDGDPEWKAHVQREDVLVCGELRAVQDLEPARLPQTLVVVNDRDYVEDTMLNELHAADVCVLQYRQGIAEFLRGLALHIPLGSLSLPCGPSVGELDRVEDIRTLLLDSHHAVPVLAENGSFRGTLSRSDLSRPGKCRVILVDHFELPQAVRGVDQAEVLEIVDHHRVGDIQTGNPIRVECRPVGSASTIVASQFFDYDVQLDPGTATLLLGGIVADTLVLRGPTTTDTDRKLAPRLAEIAGVDLNQFGTEVLIAGDDLVTSTPNEIWNRDQKQFSIRNQNFAVAQLETASLEHLPQATLDEFRELVVSDQRNHDRLLSLLVLTDVLKGDSWMFSAESRDATGVVRDTFSAEYDKPDWLSVPGVVSRKKQIVPRIMQHLAN